MNFKFNFDKDKYDKKYSFIPLQNSFRILKQYKSLKLNVRIGKQNMI
jgi:hypothetical protein